MKKKCIYYNEDCPICPEAEEKPFHGESIRIQECTCQCHQTHSNYHDSNVGRCCNNPDAFEPSNEDTKDCRHWEHCKAKDNQTYFDHKHTEVHTCTPTDTDTKEGKSFFDLPEQEKREIVEKAAKDSNAAQRKLMDTKVCEHKNCHMCMNGAPSFCSAHQHEPVSTTQLSKTNPKLESNQENSLNDRKSSVSTTDTWAEEFDNDFPEDAADISKMNPAMWNMARTEMKQFIRKTVEADRQRSIAAIKKRRFGNPPKNHTAYASYNTAIDDVLKILQDKGEEADDTRT